MTGVRYFEDPPKTIKWRPDGTIEAWHVSPARHAAEERKTIDESFDALQWRQRFERLGKLLRKKERTIVMLSRKVGELERRLSGKGTPPIGDALKLYDGVLKSRVANCTYQSRRPRARSFVDAIGVDRAGPYLHALLAAGAVPGGINRPSSIRFPSASAVVCDP